MPGPRRWKDEIWRRLEDRFAQRDTVEQVNRAVAETAEELARARKVQEDTIKALEQGLGQQRELERGLDDLQTQLRELRATIARQNADLHTRLLRDAEDLIALSVVLAPTQPFPRLGGWALGPDSARFVVESVLSSKPDHVIECGSGTSTVLIALALEKIGAGRLSTLEHDLDYLRKTERLLVDNGLDSRVELVHAPLGPVEVENTTVDWYRLPDRWLEGKQFDLVLVDGPPSTENMDRYPALPVLRRNLSARAIMIVDDASRDEEEEIVKLWEQRYPEFRVEFLPHSKGTAIVSRRAKSGSLGAKEGST